ncbi:acyl-CoA carboxylase subunit epsilon [Kitasatospora sp. DSM 101779]|uniref:acyl-CoA carboxylase subunit epsilon n=1 Tax=Kitasatospora sp. DSM 101779 TaxID=2853165 RepID=UPI0021D9B424|nr:acyl-CoA carboxylase subunit epsilon [Kitasatospora sp. DSM 101779]MCU7824450.1 acyl-CoA carboxylase subunit epsilon [Kitasatospora sp. DSM 101779]
MAPIQVLHGQPTPEELATVLAVVQSRAAAAQAAAEAAGRAGGPASPWRDHARKMRSMPTPGPAAWRTSGWAR